MIDIGILGASGYAGAEIVRLLLTHPLEKRLHLSSVSFEGKKLEAVYPAFAASPEALVLESADAVIDASQVVFSCLPHGHAEAAAKRCLEKKGLFIDISADFRFGEDQESFTTWYGKSYGDPSLYAQAVYGLPELNRTAIKKARLIAVFLLFQFHGFNINLRPWEGTMTPARVFYRNSLRSTSMPSFLGSIRSFLVTGFPALRKVSI